MRYIILSYPFYQQTATATDFRLIAFCIAFFRRVFQPEVYVVDTDTGDYIFLYRKHYSVKKKPFLAPVKEMADFVAKRVKA